MARSVCSLPRLGVDELYIIMLYATADSIDAKFTVSQVCRTWRSIALDTAVLWSAFSIGSRADAFRLLTVLERTRMARLRIRLDFSTRTRSIIDENIPVFDADDRVGIYHEISPHMPRVRVLDIDFGCRPEYIESFEPLDVLFQFPIPCMEHLCIQWRVRRWLMESDIFRYRPVSPIRVPLEAAIRLRSLTLMNVTPDDWAVIAVPTLEILDVETRVYDPFMLRGVLHNCPNLTSLSLCPTDTRDFQFEQARLPVAPLRSIRSVRVGMPFTSAWSVLSPAIDAANLERATVSIPGNESSLSVQAAYDSLLHGFGYVVSCLLSTTFGQPRTPSTAVFEVRNEHSHVRRVEVERVYPFREHVRGFWMALSHSAHGLGAIQSLSIARHMMLITSSVFRDNCPSNIIENLTVALSESFLADESFLALVGNAPTPEPMPCPALKKLTLEIDDGASRKFRVAIAVLGLVDLGNRSRNAEVCLTTRRRVHWVDRFQEEISDRACWTICAHCLQDDRATDAGDAELILV